MHSSSERAVINSKAMRRASVTNSKEDLTLEKEKVRLNREFRAQELQLKAAQKRFEQRRGSHIYAEAEESKLGFQTIPKQNESRLKPNHTKCQPERKVSVGSLPPIHEQSKEKEKAIPSLKTTPSILISHDLDNSNTNRLTKEALKSHDVNENRKSKRSTSLLPPVRDLCSRSSTGSSHFTDSSHSSSSVNSQADSDNLKPSNGKNRSMSISVPPPVRRLSVVSVREQESRLAEGTGTWPRRKAAVSLSSTSLRARIKFLTTLTTVLQPSQESKAENVDSKTSDEIKKELENCRYLRRPPLSGTGNDALTDSNDGLASKSTSPH